MSNYIFLEQMKEKQDFLTVAIIINMDELSKLKIKSECFTETQKIINGQINWEEVSNEFIDFVSLQIVDLKVGPIKNRFNYETLLVAIERQLEARQQNLSDFAIDSLLEGLSDDDSKVYIKEFDTLHTNKKVVLQENETIGFLLSNFLLWSESKNKTQEYISKAYKNELDNFQRFITKYPTLGAYHDTGKRIIEAIKESKPTILSSTSYFRAREVTESRVYDFKDMEAPKSEYVKSEGRYNHIGIPVLYLASDKNTCIAEMMEMGQSKLLWFQEFSLNDLHILDLTTTLDSSASDKYSLLIAALIYEGIINQGSSRKSVWKPEYYIPRFVADVAKMVGIFDGIKFSSNRGQGHNLALFNWNKKYKFVNKPKESVYTRKELFNLNTPPWNKELYSMVCPNCNQQISQQLRQCTCGKINPFYFMDDDI